MSVFVVRLRQSEWSVVPCREQLRQLQLQTSLGQLRVVAMFVTLAVHGCMLALGGMALAVQGGMAAHGRLMARAGGTGGAAAAVFLALRLAALAAWGMLVAASAVQVAFMAGMASGSVALVVPIGAG